MAGEMIGFRVVALLPKSVPASGFTKEFLNRHYPRFDYPKWWRNELWERSIDPKTRLVYDVTGKRIDPMCNWQVGHHGMTHAERQLWAAENGLSRQEWFIMEHNFSNFRPELPMPNASNRYNDWLQPTRY